MGILTVINGDIGTIATGSSAITGFHDTPGDIYTQTPANMGTVNGKIFSCTNSTTGPTSAGPNAVACSAATQARLDAQAAYLALVAMPSGANPGANLAGLTLAPGVYTAPRRLFPDTGRQPHARCPGQCECGLGVPDGDHAHGWRSRSGCSQSVILAGGAQARNIFWQVGTAADDQCRRRRNHDGNHHCPGRSRVLDGGNVAIVTLQGRAISLGASVTVVNTVINVPGP